MGDEGTLAGVATRSVKRNATKPSATRKVFISHASADQPLVKALADLIRLGSDVNREDIVCTSLDGMRPPKGADFIDWIKQRLAGAALVIEVVTPSYWESQFCVCELGAQWGLGLEAYPLLAPGMDYADLRAVLSNVQAGRLDDASDLSDLHDRLGEVLDRRQSTANWAGEQRRFLRKLPSIMKKVPGPSIVSAADFAALEEDLEVAHATVEERDAEIERLKEALSICQAGGTKSEVADALASDEDEAFEALIDQARHTMRRLPGIVRTVVWQSTGNPDGAPFHPDVDEWPEVRAEAGNARLTIDEDDGVWLRTDDLDVEDAVAAIEELNGTEAPDGFASEFKRQNRMTFDLDNR